MTPVSRDSFGFLIAYLIPGFLVVAGIADYSPAIREWLGFNGSGTATVGGFLYVTIASMMAGMTLGALRWLVLDRIHHLTGVKQPFRDFSTVHQKRNALEYLVDMHYRYYEFFGHMLLAILGMAANFHLIAEHSGISSPLLLAVLVALAVLYYFASRDALRKFYERTEALLTR